MKADSLAALVVVGGCALCSLPLKLLAQPVNIDLATCGRIANDAERLKCYDSIARPVTPGLAEPEKLPTDITAVPTPQAQEAKNEKTAELQQARSFLSRTWELERVDKRGTFEFSSYQQSYFFPLHVSDGINRAPTSPAPGRTVNNLPPYKTTEAKLQLSFKTKLVQSIGPLGSDLWFGYTQQALWQLWAGNISTPFRSVDYEPELILTGPVPPPLQDLPLLSSFGWKFRMLNLGLAHQSNGQTQPSSRSWNRVYLMGGFEKDDFSVLAKFNRRLPERDDDNPDLTDFVGRAELQGVWRLKQQTLSLRLRNNLQASGKGSVQFDWQFPLAGENLKGHIQLFSGYGETLLDYNYKRNTASFGLTLIDW
jgi:phospholipase A1/A2